MAITKETKIIKTEIVGDYKAIQIAEDIIYKEDGVITNTMRHRRVLHPCDVSKNTETNEVKTRWTDTSNESQEIKDIVNLVWTDEIKNSWETFLKDQL
jgi:glucose-6-phosphate isomerase